MFDPYFYASGLTPVCHTIKKECVVRLLTGHAFEWATNPFPQLQRTYRVLLQIFPSRRSHQSLGQQVLGCRFRGHYRRCKCWAYSAVCDFTRECVAWVHFCRCDLLCLALVLLESRWQYDPLGWFGKCRGRSSSPLGIMQIVTSTVRVICACIVSRKLREFPIEQDLGHQVGSGTPVRS